MKYSNIYIHYRKMELMKKAFRYELDVKKYARWLGVIITQPL